MLTNGSIYIEMAHLTAGQQFLLALPDEQMPADAALDAASMQAALGGDVQSGVDGVGGGARARTGR